MFPPERRGRRERDPQGYWLTPEQAAIMRIKAELFELGPQNLREKARVVNGLRTGDLKVEKNMDDCSYTCRAGLSTFWFNWKGQMITCGIIGEDPLEVIHEDPDTIWEQMNRQVCRYRHPDKCTRCPYETICVRCAAASHAETGDFEAHPPYVCELMEAYVRRMSQLDETGKISLDLKEV